MEWQDDGIVLSARRFGEHDAIIEVMTPNHGRARGFVKAGMSRRSKANLQPGNQLKLTWRSRIENNLGRFQLELLHSPLGNLISDGSRMSALAAVTAVVSSTMPEREVHFAVYSALAGYVALLEAEDGTLPLWAAKLAQIELGVLAELGYGLDLSVCAVSGGTENLAFVSPKSGRAVSADAGAPYRPKLLALPDCMRGIKVNTLTSEEALLALRLTGYFLERNVWVVSGTGQPDARERLIDSLAR